MDSVFDFGLRAKQPEHAELLDYLAVEFIESGYSFKHLHRLIVTSEAYQLTSSTRGSVGATLAADANNAFYWRMNTQRMQSQVVRDSLLAMSGQLDPTLGGPSVDVGEKSRRRSLYFKHSRDQHDKFLTMFDDADLLQCYRRDESIVPQQALALSNSKLSIELAAGVASRIAERAGTTRRDFAASAFEILLARNPNTDELDACVAYCEELEQLVADGENRESTIRSRLVQALLNHNDFISIR